MAPSDKKIAEVVDLNKLAGDVPEALKQAIGVHGFDKIAAMMYGVDEVDEHSAAKIIGTNFFLKRAENRTIADGLFALAEYEKDAATRVRSGLIGHKSSVLPLLALGAVGAAGHAGQAALTAAKHNRGKLGLGAGAAAGAAATHAAHKHEDGKKDEKKKDKE